MWVEIALAAFLSIAVVYVVAKMFRKVFNDG